MSGGSRKKVQNGHPVILLNTGNYSEEYPVFAVSGFVPAEKASA